MYFLPIFVVLFLSMSSPKFDNIIIVTNIEMLIKGSYKGKNVYLQNPHDGTTKYCIQEVYVNNRKMDVPQSSAIEVNLSHLKLADEVTIRVIHFDECSPKLINPQAIR